MNFIDFLSPILRRKFAFVILFAVFFGGFYGLSTLIPDIQKTTVYFTVKPVVTEAVPQASLDPAESTSKVAEMIAGWAKNPGFRNEVLETAEVYIPHFKRKLTARKQNRMNVFWTIKLFGPEAEHSEKIVEALLTVFEKNFAEFNAESASPYGFGTPSVAREGQAIPRSWLMAAAIFLSFFLAFFGIYLFEAFTRKVSFVPQVTQIFRKSPVLKVSQKLGKHDGELLEQFIITFPSPRLIGTFAVAEKFFSISDLENLDLETDTPILLVRLGETTIHDLENLRAIFGKDVGVVIFEK